jgi:hypothetical protein
MYTQDQKRIMFRAGQYNIPRVLFDVTTARWTEDDWIKALGENNWTPRSFAPEVTTDSSGKFYGNALRFLSRTEAEDNARNLAARWILVREWRVVETKDPANYLWENGALVDLLGVKCNLCGQVIRDGKPCGCGARK